MKNRLDVVDGMGARTDSQSVAFSYSLQFSRILVLRVVYG